MIDWSLMIEMLILFIDSFDKIVTYWNVVVQYSNKLYLFVDNEVERLLLNTINTT